VYSWRASVGPVDLAFTDRYGGVSAAPYDELNLALEDADDPMARAENLRRVVADFAPDLIERPGFSMETSVCQLRQVHGAEVDVVDDRRGSGWLPEADAMVSTEPAVVLMVRVADCVPVLLADPVAGVVGAVHSGRIGTTLDVTGKTVARMRSLGAGDITAWIGPHVCGRCYEVPAQLRDEVAAVVPATRSETSWGTPALDLGAGVAAQLAAAGVPAVLVDRCTLEDEQLHSYRRDGAGSGRLAGLVWIP